MIDILGMLAGVPGGGLLTLASGVAAEGGSNLKLWAYVVFVGLVLVFLALELGVFHREAHEVSMKEAATWSVIWLTCGLAFSGVVWAAYQNHWLGLGLITPMYNPQALVDSAAPLIISGAVEGKEAAKQYLTGYIVEKSLAMDNIFVIALIFSFFAIPGEYQHRVLFWGVIGVVAMRFVMIALGAALVAEFQWILYFFGAFLFATGVKMLVMADREAGIGDNPVLRFLRARMRVTDQVHGERFFVRLPDPATGRTVLWATPLFLCLVLVEAVDLVFAVDSVPAIFAITTDPFIVYTSNIFAILGLRSLYFALAAMMHRFRYLKYALATILLFVGTKIFLVGFGVKMPAVFSLSVTAGLIAAGILFSLWKTRGDAQVTRAEASSGR